MNSPSHVSSLQSESSMLFPSQVQPPFEGGGSSHVLLLVLIPDPHVTLQVLYAPHDVHTPLTVIERNSKKHSEYISCFMRCN